MTNSNPIEYVNLYSDETASETPIIPAKIEPNSQNISEGYSTIIDSGTPPLAEDKPLQVPLWLSQPEVAESVENDEQLENETPRREKKSRRQRRSLGSQYAELDTEDKQVFVFNKVYNVLKKLILNKDEMTALLYSLGDAIASEAYPPAPQRKSRYATAKVDPQTIVEYIEQLSDEDKAELLAQITSISM